MTRALCPVAAALVVWEEELGGGAGIALEARRRVFEGTPLLQLQGLAIAKLRSTRRE